MRVTASGSGGIKMDNLYLVMPAYNEEANIESVVSAWYPVLEGKGEGSRLIVAEVWTVPMRSFFP